MALWATGSTAKLGRAGREGKAPLPKLSQDELMDKEVVAEVEELQEPSDKGTLSFFGLRNFGTMWPFVRSSNSTSDQSKIHSAVKQQASTSKLL